MPAWYWPSGSTIPTWVTTGTPTATTACATSNAYVLWSPASQTASATGSTWSLVQDRAWLAHSQQLASLQQAQAMQAYYNNHCNQLAPLQQGLAAPAISTHQEQARRDQALYRRAIAEHNEQEAARLLRLIEDRERTAAERQRLIDQQAQTALEQQRQRAAAGDRARALLLEHLSPAQRKTFTEHGWFVVEGGRTKTRYRIRSAGAAGNIDVLQGERATARLCCHAQSHIPLGDQWLAQKIMLELAEDDFLRIANRTAV
jgi:hypothetical protein